MKESAIKQRFEGHLNKGLGGNDASHSNGYAVYKRGSRQVSAWLKRMNRLGVTVLTYRDGWLTGSVKSFECKIMAKSILENLEEWKDGDTLDLTSMEQVKAKTVVTTTELETPNISKGGEKVKEKKKHNPNRDLSTVDVLDRLKENQPDLWERAEIVGKWVWLSFESKPDQETRDYLKGLGFHWSKRRSAWQHPCGKFSGKSKYNPIWKYGTVKASEVAEEIAA